ncbi:MAG TPA: PAC2 family protein [Acidimicrobiales bacterium]|nr:PAC2 family protein [Acidimicrobiales bacterium]
MGALEWTSRPDLRNPIMVAAFGRWTDAGGAATAAAKYLAGELGARQFAAVDAEEFYDFTSLRPEVRLRDDRSREIVWPVNRFLAASTSGPHDVVIVVGIEPHLRWRAFCGCLTTVAKLLQVQAVFTLGVMLAEVAHTRATPVRASTADPKLATRLGLQPPRYQGPTGIVGVLQDAFAQAGIPVGSLMAQVPHYVPGTPSPKATLAIVNRVCDLLKIRVATAKLEVAARAYEREVNKVVEGDEDVARYVRQIERRTDEILGQPGALPSGDALAAELERFLREQDGP